MKELLAIALGLFLLNSCTSENEDKGIKEVLSFYGGRCKYSMGVSSSTEKGKKKYFEIELSKSKEIEKQSKISEIPASNIAYLFFKNLNEDEKQNYDEIHSVLILSDTAKFTFKYPTSLLQTVSNKVKIADKVVGLLKQKDFDSIASLLNETFIKYNKQEFIEKMKNAEAQFGNISNKFQLQGFKISPMKNGIKILHILGVIPREKEANEFRIDVDLNSDKDEIFLMDYTWEIHL